MMTGWVETDENTKLGIVICNFYKDVPKGLKLTVGDSVHILKVCGEWYYGFLIQNRQEKGIFPRAYVHIKKCSLERSGSQETIVPNELSIVQEITSVLREWSSIWKDLYVQTHKRQERDPKLVRLERISYIPQGDKSQHHSYVSRVPQGSDFEDIHLKMEKLIDWRRLLMSRKLTMDEIKELKQKVTNEIDMGNVRLGLDLVVRDEEGNLVNPAETSTISLYRQHKYVAQRIQERESALKVPKKVTNFNLFVDIRNFVCYIGEDSDILIGLYDAKAGQFISDQFIMKWDNHGMPKNIELLNNLRVLFTDLGVNDITREKVCLVCQVIRIGRMDLKEPDNKRQTRGLRRPFGVAVLDVTGILKETVETAGDKPHFIPFLGCGERDFLESLVKKHIAAKEINHKGQGLFVNIQLLHGDLKQVQKEFPHLVNNSTAIARKMGFPEVILPGDVRNDLYVNLIQGEFKKGAKTADKNVEVTMCVCNSKGEVLQNVISEGAGGEMISHYKSVIYYHEDRPKWCETVKIMIPLNDFYGSHLKFMFKHRSSNDTKDKLEKPFGVSYIKLMCDDGTTLRDTVHNMLIYKIDNKKGEEPLGYLKLPSTEEELDRSLGFVNNKQSIHSGALSWNQSDHFQVSTLICSTKLTHNVDLMGMLKWRDNPAGLEDHLKKFMKVEGEEIVKSIQDTLDALFNILIQNSNSELYVTLVFDAIVYVLNVIQSAKYEQFRPVLDVYIKENFSATLAYNKLLEVIKDYVDRAHSAKECEQDRYIKAMKALEYIFKFVVRSRVLFAALNENRGKGQFEMLLKQVFQSINSLMMNSTKAPTPIAVQGQLLKYLPQTIADIMTVFDPLELSYILTEFLSVLPQDQHVFRKLQCMDDIVHTAIFLLPECRKVLLPVFLSHIQQLLEKDQESEICITILSDIMHLLFSGSVGSTVDDLSVISLKVLRTVIQAVIRMNRDSVLIGNSVAVVIAILRQMTQVHYIEYLDHFETDLDLMDFLMEILMLFQDLIQKGVYPPDWNEMIMLQNSVFLHAMRFFSDTIRVRFITNFEYQLWNNYFHCAIAFMTQDALQLERFSATKRNKILSLYKDMRRETGFSLLNMWYSLGSHKIKFIPDLVGPVLEMTLIPEIELRKKTIPIFFDMMHTEFWEKKGKNRNFSKFESEMITQLDALVECGQGDSQYKDLFYDIMIKKCESNQALCVAGVKFVQIFQELMQRLLEYRDVVHDEIRENKMSCTVNLLNFYHKLDRQEMYIHYLHKLCDLHLECDNFTEAACTLMLYTDLLKWSDVPLPAILKSNKYPDVQTHRALKERLYYDIIDYFDKGQMWEKGLELCKELAKQYETETFDYFKLGQLLQRQAKFYNNIVQPDVIRPEPGYFRVGYFGLGFPSFLQNQVFIYRGKAYEKLLTFTARIQNLFPTAQLMKTLNPPTEEIKNGPRQYLQINAVTPIMMLKPHFRKKKVLDEILKYYKVNEVQQFTFSKPKDESKSDVTKLWLEKHILMTSQPFPGILQWFPVIQSRCHDVSPLENALETIIDKNECLLQVINQHILDPELRVDELERILGGVVDAAVNGGIANYKIFYSKEYLEEHDTPKDRKLVSRLKDVTTNQMVLLQRGLDIHGSKAPDDLRPLHEHMEVRFNQMKEFVAKDFNIVVTNDQYIALSRQMGLILPNRPITKHVSVSSSSDYAVPEVNGQRSEVTPISSQRSVSIANLPSRMTAILNRSTSTTAVQKDSYTKAYTRIIPSVLSGKRNSVEGSQSNKSDDSEQSASLSSSVKSEGATSQKGERDSQVIELNQSLTPARPLRSENGRQSRPTSGQFRSGSLSVAPISNSYSLMLDDDSPPPLPEKQSQSDYINMPFTEDDMFPQRDSTVTRRNFKKAPAELPEGLQEELSDDMPPAIPPKGLQRQRQIESD